MKGIVVRVLLGEPPVEPAHPDPKDKPWLTGWAGWVKRLPLPASYISGFSPFNMVSIF
jgi:hypothetical protein